MRYEDTGIAELADEVSILLPANDYEYYKFEEPFLNFLMNM
jgi:hypothetical protein